MTINKRILTSDERVLLHKLSEKLDTHNQELTDFFGAGVHLSAEEREIVLGKEDAERFESLYNKVLGRPETKTKGKK